MDIRQNLEKELKEVASRTSLSTYQYHQSLKELIKLLEALIPKFPVLWHGYAAKQSNEEFSLLAYSTNLYQILQRLFVAYQDPLNHNNPTVFMDKIIRRGRVAFEDWLLEMATKCDENQLADEQDFLMHYGFFPILLLLHKLRMTSLPFHRLTEQLKLCIQDLKVYLHFHGVILPTQQMIDFVEIAIRANAIEDLNLALAMLAVAIKKWIPYHKRDEAYYRDVNWKSLEVISELAYMPSYKNFTRNNAVNVRNDLLQFVDELKKLKAYEVAICNGEVAVPPVHLPFQVLHLWERYYSDIENLTYMRECLQNSLAGMQDSPIFRLAILRVLTVLGEGTKNISVEMENSHPIFEHVKPIRNEIVHQRNNNGRVYLSLLLEEQHNQSLFLLVRDDFPIMVALLTELITWRTANPASTTVPVLIGNFQFPRLTEFCDELTHEFRLTRPERDYLLSTFPATNRKITTEKRERLKDLLSGKIPTPPASDVFIECFNGYRISDSIVNTPITIPIKSRIKS